VGSSAYSLFDRGIVVKSGHQCLHQQDESEDIPVTLQDIDIVELQPLQRRLNRVKDVLYVSSDLDLQNGADLSAKTVLIDLCFPDWHEAFGQDDIAFPRCLAVSVHHNLII
jgi:hypothetical protein